MARRLELRVSERGQSRVQGGSELGSKMKGGKPGLQRQNSVECG